MTRIVWLIPLFLLVAACTPGEEPDTDDINLDEVIVFPDPKMESFIRLRAHLDADEPITVRKVKNLIYLECISCGITDLTGLEKMPWVKELHLNGNPVISLEPLRGQWSGRGVGVEEGSVLDIRHFSVLVRSRVSPPFYGLG